MSAAALGAALLFFFAGTLLGEPAGAKDHAVSIRGMEFVPKVLRILPGDSVTWTNDDVVPHAIQSAKAKKAWKSKDLPPRGSWRQVFTEGASYICPFHPAMTGEIVVEPRAQPSELERR